MRFYYNAGMNVCADENWVVEYLIVNDYCANEEEALDGLHHKRVFYDWFECEVANSIADKFETQLIGY